MKELQEFYFWLIRQLEHADLDTIHEISFDGETLMKLELQLRRLLQRND